VVAVERGVRTGGQGIIPRDLTRRYPTIVRGEGIRLWDDEGREYIDADSGAISCISIGHGVAEVADAMADQARRTAYVHSGQFAHDVPGQLARALADFAPGDLNRSILVSGGSEAVETAVKLARHYHVVSGRPERSLVVARRRSYHGNTVLGLSLSDVGVRKEAYQPYLLDVPRVAESYCYRCPFALEYPSCGLACADDLERVVEDVGAERISAFIAEPIVAAAGPAMTPPPDYFARIRQVCDAYGIVFIADEVVTGFGRTGRNFGVEHWGVVPDVVVTGKGIASGYAPLAAVIASDRIVDAFEAAGTPFSHGLTWENHPVACAAGLAVLRIIERDRLVENAARQGEHLFARLADVAVRQPTIGDVRGKGLLAGIEFVSDRETQAPFASTLQFGRRVCAAAEARGLMIYPGAVDDQLLISPPLIVQKHDVDLIVERFERALEDVTSTLA
jgi:adenosylmethionine-8-amino-7-oxononanoate aminotransferase